MTVVVDQSVSRASNLGPYSSNSWFPPPPGVLTSLVISGTPSVATVGTAYSWTPTASGGSGTKTYALTDILGVSPVVLPPGLSFNTSTGEISGTPTNYGYYSGLIITVTDSSGSAASSMLGIHCKPASTVLAFGSRSVHVGDSITAQGATTGLRNQALQIQSRSSGKLRITVGSDQGIGGETMTQINSRAADVYSQKPDIIFNHWGHNDGFGTSQTLSTLRTRARNIINSQLSNTTAYIVILTTIPSLVATDQQTLYAQFVQALKADVAGFFSSNIRIAIIDVAPGYDPAKMNITDAGSYIHPNPVGAKWMADPVLVFLNNFIAAGTLLPTTRGAEELLPSWGQSGTGGTLVNATGTAPDNITITNNLGGTSAVVADKINILGDGSVAAISLNITGTPAAEGLVTIDYPAITLPGGFGPAGLLWAAARLIIRDRTDAANPAVGFRNLALLASTASGSTTGNLAQGGIATNDPNASTYPDPSGPIDWQVQAYPKMYWDDLGTAYFRITLRFAAVDLNAYIEIRTPTVQLSGQAAYAAPFRLTAGAPASATQYSINGTLANGQTVQAYQGAISGGNIAGNLTYQWTKNGVDISGATSKTLMLSGWTTGDVIGCNITINNGIAPNLAYALPTRTYP